MLPTAEQITKLYLYGSEAVPNVTSDVRINHKAASINVSLKEFMTKGAGRFVNAQSFDWINDFFECDNSLFEYLKNKNPEVKANSDGSYSFEKFMMLQGLGIIDEDGKPVGKAYTSFNQLNASDEIDDYVERVYI